MLSGGVRHGHGELQHAPKPPWWPTFVAKSSNRGDAAGDPISDIEWLAAALTATLSAAMDAANQIKGGAGSDTLYGRSGNDVWMAAQAATSFMAESGKDLLIGGERSGCFRLLARHLTAVSSGWIRFRDFVAAPTTSICVASMPTRKSSQAIRRSPSSA